jgi:hypothetical protein
MKTEALARQSNSLATQTLSAVQLARMNYSIAILMREIISKLHDATIAATLVAAALPGLDGASAAVTQSEEIERTMRKVYAEYVVRSVDPIESMRAIARAATVRMMWIRFHDLADELSSSLKRIT